MTSAFSINVWIYVSNPSRNIMVALPNSRTVWSGSSWCLLRISRSLCRISRITVDDGISKLSKAGGRCSFLATDAVAPSEDDDDDEGTGGITFRFLGIG